MIAFKAGGDEYTHFVWFCVSTPICRSNGEGGVYMSFLLAFRSVYFVELLIIVTFYVTAARL